MEKNKDIKEKEMDDFLIKSIDHMSAKDFEKISLSLLKVMGLEIKSASFSESWGEIEAKRKDEDQELDYLIIIERGTEVIEPELLQEVLEPVKSDDRRLIYITTSYISEDARTYAEGFDIDLADGNALAALLRKYDLVSNIMLRREEEIIMEEKGRYLPSIDELEKVMDAARDLYLKKEYEKSLELYTQATEMKPNYDNAWFMRGVILNEFKEHEEALNAFATALENNVENEEAWYNLGVTLYYLGRFDEEIEAYDKALALRKDYIEALNNKGATLYKLKRYEEAVECYDALLKIDNTYHKAWFNKGMALKKLKNNEHALISFTQALKHDDKFFEAAFYRGRALLDLKNYREAFLALDTALTLKPKSFEAWYYKGVSLEKMNLLERAIECFDQVLALKPDFKRAKTKRSKLKKLKRSKKKKGESQQYEPLPMEKVSPGPGIELALKAIIEAEEKAAEKRILVEKRDESPILEESFLSEKAEEEVENVMEELKTVDTDDFECFGEYEEDDEGCNECEIKARCMEINRTKTIDKKPKKRPGIERYDCFGEFDEDDDGCKDCSVGPECKQQKISKGGS